MISLKSLEEKFQQYLLDGTPDIFDHTVSTALVSAETRLGIYAYAYRSRLNELLTSSFPILLKFLGDNEFKKLCDAYIQHYPSDFRSIRWFGDKLAWFLKTDSVYQAFPYLSELALLEWTVSLVFDGENAEILLLDAMAELSPEAWGEMKLTMNPTMHRLSFKWNVVQMWEDLSDENDSPPPVEADEIYDWVFWRKDLKIKFSALPKDEAWAFDAMNQGKHFGDMCEGLCTWNKIEDVGMRAASLLKSWITFGLVSKIYF